MKKIKFWELAQTITMVLTMVLGIISIILIYQQGTKPIPPEVLNVELINNITQNNDFDCNSINDMNINDNEKNWYYNQCKIIKGE